MNLHSKQKKTCRTILATVLCCTAFFLFSLSCASSPKQRTVKIADIKSWTAGTSVSIPCSPELSVIQWKYLVTELNKIKGLDNITLSASNSLTAMNLESTIKINGTPLKYIYSLKSTDKLIILEISDVEEVDAKTNAFSYTMPVKEIDDFKESVIKRFTAEMTEHGHELVTKKTALEY